MAKKRIEILPPWFDSKSHFRRQVLRYVIQLFGWIGMAAIYYVGFSFFFDTPLEYRMKASTKQLGEQYELLTQRYDSIEVVLNNVVERDRNVFKILFEAEPYDFNGQFETNRWVSYERLLTKSNRGLGEEFFKKSQQLDKNMQQLQNANQQLLTQMESLGNDINYIPAIQPVINNDLTLLTASYGMRIHPFYKSLTSHQGVDYTVPEGSRVFATADGTVRDVIKRRTSSGLTVVISHGNGYETTYSHLSKINVSKGQSVKRGDIIALSGNTGLSLAPHLHYEIKHNDMRVDPIHYFFKELTPQQYQKMIKIAQSGMQSFD